MSSDLFYPSQKNEIEKQVIRKQLKNYNECPHCKKLSRSKYDLQQHIKAVHEKLKLYQCDQCFAKFARKYTLKKHCDTVHCVVKNNECPNCHYKFSEASDLKRHIKSVHENVKPFGCNKCEINCRSNFDLQRHINQVHEKKKPFQCSLCDRQFGEMFCLKRHFSKIHNMNKVLNQQSGHTDFQNAILDFSKPVPRDKESYVSLGCDLCPFFPVNEKELYQHFITDHKSERPYKCRICNFRFKKELDLREHELSQCLKSRLQFLQKD